MRNGEPVWWWYGGKGGGRLSRDERPTVMSPRFAHPHDLVKRTHFREAAFPLRWKIFLFGSSHKMKPNKKTKDALNVETAFVALARVLKAWG